jgi:hypothetical protein
MPVVELCGNYISPHNPRKEISNAAAVRSADFQSAAGVWTFLRRRQRRQFIPAQGNALGKFRRNHDERQRRDS